MFNRLFGEVSNVSQPTLRLASAVEAGDLVAALRALEKSADPNYRDPQGRDILLMAVLNADLAMIEALFEAGADINIISQHGNTAMDIAADVGDPEIVIFLLNHGAQRAEKLITEQARAGRGRSEVMAQGRPAPVIEHEAEEEPEPEPAAWHSPSRTGAESVDQGSTSRMNEAELLRELDRLRALADLRGEALARRAGECDRLEAMLAEKDALLEAAIDRQTFPLQEEIEAGKRAQDELARAYEELEAEAHSLEAAADGRQRALAETAVVLEQLESALAGLRGRLQVPPVADERPHATAFEEANQARAFEAGGHAGRPQR